MGCRRTPRCFPAGGWAIPRARPTRWPCASRAAPLPSPVAGLRGLSSDRPTRVGVGITRPIGGGLAAWLAHRPPWIVVVAGLVAVVALGYVDFATGPELTPLLFYLAPVALVAWYAGRGAGAGPGAGRPAHGRRQSPRLLRARRSRDRAGPTLPARLLGRLHRSRRVQARELPPRPRGGRCRVALGGPRADGGVAGE